MKRGLFFLLTCLMFLPAVQSWAEAVCRDCDRSLAPRLWIPEGDPALDSLPLKSSKADIRIDGPIARVTVTQRYGNAGQRAINARYVFPGATRAAVHGLTMKIGERVVRARIKEKEEARKLFEAAKQEGKRTALLDQQRPNVFMMDVANLLPGDDIELTLQYCELLVPEEGVYEFVYPTVVGPRYGGDPVRAEREGGWIASPYATNRGKGNPATVATDIRVHLASPLPLADLRSTQHEISTAWKSAKEAEIALAPSESGAGNRDFILRFRMQDKQIASGLMTFSQDGEHYFLMMAQPPERVAPAQVLKREYLFVVDVSGSMHGFPLDTARALMAELLAGLKPTETFNILFFAGGAQVLAPAPLAATPDNLARAMAMMRAYDGGGGTELLPALRQAFAMPRSPDTARGIVVVTDGYVDVEREAYDLIEANLNASNLFAIGIGASVNRHLIETLAHAGAGEPFIVTEAAEAAEVGARFRRYVAAPLLSDIEVHGDGVALYDMEPGEIPVMLAERPIVAFGKYRGGRPGATLELTGRSAGGTYRARMPLADAGDDTELLPILWARQRLMRLSDNRGNDAAEHRDEIIKLGLQYSLLSRYTAFIAVDEVVANQDGQAKDVNQPLPLPQGVSELAVARAVPEPDLFWMLAILAVLYGGAWLARQRLRRIRAA